MLTSEENNSTTIVVFKLLASKSSSIVHTFLASTVVQKRGILLASRASSCNFVLVKMMARRDQHSSGTVWLKFVFGAISCTAPLPGTIALLLAVFLWRLHLSSNESY